MSSPCPYCSKTPKLVTGKELFPHLPKLSSKHFWQCKPCGAHVGCHPNTNRAMGPVANAELRKARTDAHTAFDPLWKLNYMERNAAYKWLAETMGIDAKKAHIGYFDIDQCMMARAVSIEKFQELMMS